MQTQHKWPLTTTTTQKSYKFRSNSKITENTHSEIPYLVQHNFCAHKTIRLLSFQWGLLVFIVMMFVPLLFQKQKSYIFFLKWVTKIHNTHRIKQNKYYNATGPTRKNRLVVNHTLVFRNVRIHHCLSTQKTKCIQHGYKNE